MTAKRAFWGTAVLGFGFLAFILALYGFLRVVMWDDPTHGFYNLGLALVMSLMAAFSARQL